MAYDPEVLAALKEQNPNTPDDIILAAMDLDAMTSATPKGLNYSKEAGLRSVIGDTGDGAEDAGGPADEISFARQWAGDKPAQSKGSGRSFANEMEFAQAWGDEGTQSAPAANSDGDASRGFKRAFAQIPELLYGTGALVGMTAENLFGEGGISTATKNYFAQKFQQKQQENQQYAPTVEFDGAWDSIKKGDLQPMVDWIQDSAGYVVGQGIQTIATGGVGAIVGKAALTKMVGGMAVKQAEKLVAQSAAKTGVATLSMEEATKIAATRMAQAIGAGTTLNAQNLGMEAGDIYGGLIEEAKKTGKPITGDDLLRAWGAAAVAAGTETATDMLGLGAAAGRIKIGNKAISEMPGMKGRLARGAVAAGVGAPLEGAQEYVQTGLEQYGAGQPLDTDAAAKERLNAAAVGALGGTVMGGGAGMIARPAVGDILDPNKTTDEAIQAANDFATSGGEVQSVATLLADTDANYQNNLAAQGIATQTGMINQGRIDNNLSDLEFAAQQERLAAENAKDRTISATPSDEQAAAAVQGQAQTTNLLTHRVEDPMLAFSDGTIATNAQAADAHRQDVTQQAVDTATQAAQTNLSQVQSEEGEARPATVGKRKASLVTDEELAQIIADPAAHISTRRAAIMERNARAAEATPTATGTGGSNEVTSTMGGTTVTVPNAPAAKTNTVAQAYKILQNGEKLPSDKFVLRNVEERIGTEAMEQVRQFATGRALMTKKQAKAAEKLILTDGRVEQQTKAQPTTLSQPVAQQQLADNEAGQFSTNRQEQTSGTTPTQTVPQQAQQSAPNSHPDAVAIARAISTATGGKTTPRITLENVNAEMGKTPLQRGTVKMLRGIGSLFKKKIIFFSSPDVGTEGAVFQEKGDNRIYINVNSNVDALRVVGHELMHKLKQQAPKAYANLRTALSTVVTNKEALREMYRDYNRANDLTDEQVDAELDKPGVRENLIEEMLSDLGGNRFAEAEFWSDLFTRIEQREGREKAKGIIARLREAMLMALAQMKRLFTGNAFKADQFPGVADRIDQVRNALVEAYATYLQDVRADGKMDEDAAVVGEVRASETNLVQAVEIETPASYRGASTVLDDQTRLPHPPAGVSSRLNQMISAVNSGMESKQKPAAKFSPTRAVDTSSSEFKKWFGNSKVVDADGKPLVVYHGTNADFTEFKTTRSGEFGPGIYLTDSPREAGEYGEVAKGVSLVAPSAHVMPVFVRLTNPYTKGVDEFWREFGGGTDADGIDRAKASGYDGVIAQRPDRYYDNDARQFVDRGNMLTHYIVFSSTQIKSAISNTGEFSSTNPDIRMSPGRGIDSPQMRGLRALWLKLASHQELFQFAKSDKDTLQGVMADIDPQFKVDERFLVPERFKNSGATKWWKLTSPDGKDIEVLENANNEIWVNASHLTSGKSGGVRLYAALMNFAYNAGKVFVGDPAGVSDLAIFRRTENMLASALKFGTTEHMRPATEQTNPSLYQDTLGHKNDVVIKFSPVKWEDGNDARNLASLLKSSYDNVKAFVPEIEHVIYNFDTQRFEWTDDSARPATESSRLSDSGDEKLGPPDRAVTGEQWQVLSERLRRGLNGIGSGPERLASPLLAKKSGEGERVTTIERAALSNTVLREQGEDGIRSLLAKAGEELRVGFGGLSYSPARLSNIPSSFTVDEPSKMDSFIRSMQDKHIDLKRAVAAVKAQVGQIADKWDTYLQEELFHGRAAKGVNDFLDTEMRPLLQDLQMRGIKLDQFEEYLWMRHAKERNAQIARVNPNMPDGGSGKTDAEVDAYFNALDPAVRSRMDAVAKRVDAINKETQQWLVVSGLETQSTIDAWNATYQNYVPLHREDAETSMFGGNGTGAGFNVRGAASRRAMGSSKPVENILANIAMQRERAIVRAEKNRVAQSMYGLAITAPNADLWGAVRPNMAPQDLIDMLVNAGINPIDAKNMADTPTEQWINPKTGLVEERVNPLWSSSPNVLALRVNGEQRYVVFNVNNERAAHIVSALKNLDADQLGRVMGILARITRWFASVNTQYNPIFGVTNIVRDTGALVLNLSTTPLKGKETEVLAKIGSAWKGIYSDLRKHRKGQVATSQWASIFEEFEDAGGKTGYRDQFQNSTERMSAIEKEFRKAGEGKVKAFGRAVFDLLSDYNDTMENATRLAAYKVARDSGMSAERAASLAKNITVNFNRKGQVATQAGALYAFFNASVQGSARIAETLAGPAGKKIVAGGILLGVLNAMLLAAAGFGDDDPPDFVRERNIVIPLGGKRFASIPMPLGFHVLPNFGRLVTEWAMGGFKDTSKRIASITGSLFEALNPIGSAGWSMQTLAPTAFDPLVALSENKDWTGKPIAKADVNNLAPTPGHARAKDTATAWAKGLSHAINWATGGTEFKQGVFSPTPDQIDYLIGQIAGGAGREASKAWQIGESSVTGEDMPLHKVPLVGRFYGEAEGKAHEGAAFYAAIKRINEHEAELKGLRKQHRAEEAKEYLRENPEAMLIQAGNAAEAELRKLNHMKHEMLKRGANRDAIKLQEERITAFMRRFNERVRTLQERQKSAA